MPPPLRQFQKFNEKPRNAKCLDFFYNSHCLAFCKVSDFLYIKTSRNETCHAFVYKCQVLNSHEKLRNVKCLAFCV